MRTLVVGIVSLTTFIAGRFIISGNPGAVDSSFAPGTAAGTNCCSYGGVHSVALQPDGKIVIGGYFGTNSAYANRIERLNPDGSVDTSFDPGQGPSTFGWVYSVLVDSDGKILVGGTFSSFNGIPCGRIARFNPDGSFDEGFNAGTGANDSVQSLMLQPDGKILVIGDFTAFNGISRINIARLNPDGSVDTTYGQPFQARNAGVNVMALQPDGGLLVGGLINFYSGTNHFMGITRINPNGTVDTNFVSNPGANNAVNAIIPQPDGKIMIGGNFNHYNGKLCPGIARLNTNGTVDTTFVLQPSLSNITGVVSMLMQPDGKLLIDGYFNVNGFTQLAFVRAFPDGSMDTNFSIGSLPMEVSSIALQSDGKILLGGEFTSINGHIAYHVARLDGDPQLTISKVAPFPVISWSTSYVNYVLESRTSLHDEWSTVTNTPVIVNDRFTLTNDLHAGSEFYRLKK
jgi:uncharacterized delta-60 repeat protein